MAVGLIQQKPELENYPYQTDETTAYQEFMVIYEPQ